METPNTILLIPIIVSFLVSLFLIPLWTRKAKKAGIFGIDLQKRKKIEVAEAGGVTVLAGLLLGILIYIAIKTFVFSTTSNLVETFALLTSILILAFIGFTDDILGWKIGMSKKVRLILVIFSSIPLVVINAGKSAVGIPFLGTLDLGILYPLLAIPIGIVGATVTFNFLAGYNGLEAGQGILLLGALSIAAYMTGNAWLAVIGLCMVASLIAFLFYNFYPASIFPGDSLTYPIGGMIAIFSILGSFEKIAIFFFIPYIIETGLKLRGKLKKESYGKIMPDGSLENRYKEIYGLEHLAIHLMKKYNIKPTENSVVLSIWAFQLIIIILGFLIFSPGIV
jgi:UDP-N-acetylglucosamine--dolichyl-phosphate N-acetylglucosaminephosphotransferase